MREVQIIRNAVKVIPHIPTSNDGYGRIYDDIWPLNIAGRYCSNYVWLVTPYLNKLYPQGWDANTHMVLQTNPGYPYYGNWHQDAPPYDDDTIVMLCLEGHDDLFYRRDIHENRKGIWHADLCPGDLLLMPATTQHQGRCMTHRKTYHCRVGPKGKVMPESPMQLLPPMTLRHFVGRTWRTLRYYVRQGL